MAPRSLFVAAIFLFLTTPAHADEPEKPAPAPAQKTPVRTDTVRLRTGGLSRGRVVEIVPEDHVKIVELDGQAKEIPWSEIDRIIIGGPAPTRTSLGTTNTPMPATAKPTPKAPLSGPLAKVHLAASNR